MIFKAHDRWVILLPSYGFGKDTLIAETDHGSPFHQWRDAFTYLARSRVQPAGSYGSDMNRGPSDAHRFWRGEQWPMRIQGRTDIEIRN